MMGHLTEHLAALLSEVSYHARLPDPIFRSRVPTRVYFLDSSVFSEHRLLEAVVQFNRSNYGSSSSVVCAWPDAGSFESFACFSALREEELVAIGVYWSQNSLELLDKATLSTNSAGDWILFDVPMEELALLAIFGGDESLDVGPLDDYLMIPRYIREALAAESNFTRNFRPGFLEQLLANYARNE